jgi:hypothetical protein
MYLYDANPKSLATLTTTPTPWRWLNQVDVPWIIYEKVCVKALAKSSAIRFVSRTAQ